MTENKTCRSNDNGAGLRRAARSINFSSVTIGTLKS
jgi:hypothetical protein